MLNNKLFKLLFKNVLEAFHIKCVVCFVVADIHKRANYRGLVFVQFEDCNNSGQTVKIHIHKSDNDGYVIPYPRVYDFINFKGEINILNFYDLS